MSRKALAALRPLRIQLAPSFTRRRERRCPDLRIVILGRTIRIHATLCLQFPSVKSVLSVVKNAIAPLPRITRKTRMNRRSHKTVAHYLNESMMTPSHIMRDRQAENRTRNRPVEFELSLNTRCGGKSESNSVNSCGSGLKRN